MGFGGRSRAQRSEHGWPRLAAKSEGAAPYDCEAGEYVSQDPIGLYVGRRFHAYADDPIGAFDPLGLAATQPSQLGDHQLFERINEILYRDKRAGGGRPSGRHGLVHRIREQITGKMRPGSPGWATHDAQIRGAQKNLRDALTERDKRGLPHADPSGKSLFGQNAWDLATRPPPTGGEAKVPKGCK